MQQTTSQYQRRAGHRQVISRSGSQGALDRELQSLSPAEQELLLDVAQFSLDIIGIVEPTPFADVSNALVSLYRDDYFGAAVSSIGVIPYMGDIAKLLKLPRYVDLIRRCIHTARAGSRFSQKVKPILRKLLAVLDRLPTHRLPGTAREALRRMRRMIDEFLGGARAVSRVDRLAEEMLLRIFGSTMHVGHWPKKNVRKIVEFLNDSKYKNCDLQEWEHVFRGVDLHAADSVEVLNFKRGDTVAQYVDTHRPRSRQTGEWFVQTKGAVSHRNLGISGVGRKRTLFRFRKDARVLKTKASPALDHWTSGGTKPHGAIARTENGYRQKPALQVAGGGDQYFLPNAPDTLQRVKGTP
ncbi:MAG: hypothetical protein KDA88_16995 [Planctomycetaceae bacterium]|nr:hypothetical protein [Planctomycetaceae bacterium]